MVGTETCAACSSPTEGSPPQQRHSGSLSPCSTSSSSVVVASKDELAHPPAPGDSYVRVALKVLNQPHAETKASWTQASFELWNNGLLVPPSPKEHGAAPSKPAVDASRLNFVQPSQIRNRGKGGSLASRQALLHSLVHIECCAIDLAMDCIARWGADPDYSDILTEDFFGDFFKVAEDEARHFTLLLCRLRETGPDVDYGSFPVHAGLWESAERTSQSLPARLAVEHATHEARGLDILPQTIERFRRNSDEDSADLLQNTILEEEISHCAAGVRWIRRLHGLALVGEGGKVASENLLTHSDNGGVATAMEERQWVKDARNYPGVEEWFHSLVRRYFFGKIKLPVNKDARERAGFDENWYLPLTEG